jgi:hypothetical protein
MNRERYVTGWSFTDKLVTPYWRIRLFLSERALWKDLKEPGESWREARDKNRDAYERFRVREDD